MTTKQDPLDELTAFEVTQAEKACGIAYETIGSRKEPGDMTPGRTALWGALAWVHVKRSEPTLTYEQYMKRVKPDDILAYLFPDDEDEDGEAESGSFPEPLVELGGPARGTGVTGDGPGAEEGAVRAGDGGPAE